MEEHTIHETTGTNTKCYWSVLVWIVPLVAALAVLLDFLILPQNIKHPNLSMGSGATVPGSVKKLLLGPGLIAAWPVLTCSPFKFEVRSNHRDAGFRATV
jgi:hypothetical protein